MIKFLPVLAAALALAACGGTAPSNGTVDANSSTDQAANVSADPFGATGAPGADLTDNGASDGSNGFEANVTGNSAN